MGFMQGKRILVTGARNKWSIGWHCALAAMREGAEVAFSVYGEREESEVRKMLAELDAGDRLIAHCDATNPEQVDALMAAVGERFGGGLDGLVHSMAFAKREDLQGDFVSTSAEGFGIAMEASAYTLVALARAARPLMRAAGGGGIVTLTYLGSERAVPGYNVMGVAKAALESSVRYLAADLGPENIRVNAVSAGPIRTLAASGVAGLREMISQVAERSPLKRAVEQPEVADACAFLLSDLARGITGEVLYVDAGYHIMGL